LVRGEIDGNRNDDSGFSPDGNPRSLMIAEITSRTVQAILMQTAMDGRWKKKDGKGKAL
jgi:hypothetical protein